jgi:hypothetical protein
MEDVVHSNAPDACRFNAFWERFQASGGQVPRVRPAVDASVPAEDGKDHGTRLHLVPLPGTKGGGERPQPTGVERASPANGVSSGS